MRKVRIAPMISILIVVPWQYWLLRSIPLVILADIFVVVLMQLVIIPLVEKSVGESPKPVVQELQPEPPTRCCICNRPMWIADRDDDGTCDECWEMAEKVSFEQHEREQREFAKSVGRDGIQL